MSAYEARAAGLGERFKRAFYVTVDEILIFPEKNPVKVDSTVRTRLMRPFPYLIFYAIESATLFVLTVQYAGRRPAYMRSVVRERKTP